MENNLKRFIMGLIIDLFAGGGEVSFRNPRKAD